MSLLHCFFSTMNYGLREIFFTRISVEPWAAQNYWIRYAFDMGYWLIVIIICLNVIFGIIIDSFAQLREIASNIEEDKKNICFICGLSRYIVSLFVISFFSSTVTLKKVSTLTKARTTLSGTTCTSSFTYRSKISPSSTELSPTSPSALQMETWCGSLSTSRSGSFRLLRKKRVPK